MCTVSGIERTTSCLGNCYFLVVTIHAFEYVLLGSMSCIFPLSKGWQSYSSKARRQVQGQGKMDFSMYLLQAQEHWLSLYNWGLHLRQLSQGDEVLLLSSSVWLCKFQWNMVVIHQLMDVDSEVSPILKRRGRTMLLPCSLTREAGSVLGRN